MRSLKLVVIPFACLALTLGCGGKKEPVTPPESQPPPADTTPPVPPPQQEAEPPRTEPSGLNLDSVYFDYDRYELREDARATLAANAKSLEGNAAARVTIEGHCDERGTVEYNLALGEKRAQAARDYLVNYGIAADRLTTVSFGEERPIDAGHSEDSWAKNRRAAFTPR